jgi:hypothetical protein
MHWTRPQPFMAGFLMRGRMGGMKWVFVFAGIMLCLVAFGESVITFVPDRVTEAQRNTDVIALITLAILSFWLAKRRFTNST